MDFQKCDNNPFEDYPGLTGAKIEVAVTPTETPSFEGVMAMFQNASSLKKGDVLENGFCRLTLTCNMYYGGRDGKPHTTDNHDRQAGIADIVSEHFGV